MSMVINILNLQTEDLKLCHSKLQIKLVTILKKTCYQLNKGLKETHLTKIPLFVRNFQERT